MTFVEEWDLEKLTKIMKKFQTDTPIVETRRGDKNQKRTKKVNLKNSQTKTFPGCTTSGRR